MSAHALRVEDKPAETPDPYPYGWRVVPRRLPDGRESTAWVPLTLHDFLDPQPGDQMIQSAYHHQCTSALHDRIERYFDRDETTGVFSDLKMEWNIPGLENPAPDVAVIKGIRPADRDRSTFKVAKEGVLPCLVIEVLSPNYPVDDTEKVRIYEQAGVSEYILVNPTSKSPGIRNYRIWGYRLYRGRYHPIMQDRPDCLLSQTTGLRFCVSEDRQQVELYVAATGKRLLTSAEQEARADAAEAELAALKAHLAMIKTSESGE